MAWKMYISTYASVRDSVVMLFVDTLFSSDDDVCFVLKSNYHFSAIRFLFLLGSKMFEFPLRKLSPQGGVMGGWVSTHSSNDNLAL